MARFDAFTAGGSNTLASIAASSERLVNRYPEPVGGNQEKGPMALVRTPGLAQFAVLPQAPNRGLWPGANRLFAAGGNHAYEVMANASTVDHGFIGNDGLPAQFFPNGNQLFCFSAGLAWCDNGAGMQPCYFSIQLFDLSIDVGTGGLTGPTGGIFIATGPNSDVGETVQITSGTGFTVQTQVITSVVAGQAFGAASWGTGGSTAGQGIEWLYTQGQVTASQGAYLDGYFFAIKPLTNIIQFSAINDGTSWNPLDYFKKASYPDAAVAIQGDHQELYVFGNLESAQVFRDTGDLNSPFQPDPGAIMHMACVAPFSVCRLDEGLAFLGGDVRRGDRLAYLAVGFRPRKISTAAEEIAWASYPTIEDAVGYTEIYNGHQFWILHFPSGDATWAYDLTTGIWAERGWWGGAFDSNGFPIWHRQRQSFHAVVALGNTTIEKHYVGDWQTGQIYIQSETLLDDNGTPIYRLRRAPHMSLENKRRFYNSFEVDCDTTGILRLYWNMLGDGRDRIWQIVDWQTASTGVSLSLSWSDTRAKTWLTRRTQTLAVGVDVTIANVYLKAIDGTS